MGRVAIFLIGVETKARTLEIALDDLVLPWELLQD
jgi:hypothetical protein